jgi:hypothetical protein
MIDKRNFTCPHCHQVFGIDAKGNIGMYSYKIFMSHVDHCEKKPKLCKSC